MSKEGRSGLWSVQSESSQQPGSPSATSGGRSPAVNYINITRRPDGGIVNIEMKRQESPRGSTYESGDGVISYSTSVGSGATSPRSSIGSGTSSPRTSVVITHPPLPDHQKDSSVRHVYGPHAIVVSRGSSPGTEGRQQSPGSTRSTITMSGPMGLMESKYPSLLRGVGQRSSILHSFLHDGGLTSGRPHIWSLYDRFNEPAPPAYDTRMRGGVGGLHLSKVSVIPQMSSSSNVTKKKPEVVHNIPIKVEGRTSGMSKGEGVVYNIPVACSPSSSPAVTPDVSAQQSSPFGRFRGLQFDSVPVQREGLQSEAERNLEALTRQLENEMRLSAPPSRKPATPDSLSALHHSPSSLEAQRSPPPPYSGEVGGKVAPGMVRVMVKRDVGDAERKVESLAQELETQLGSSTSSLDYYGDCFSCGQAVNGSGEACQAMGRLYHTGCFTCTLCGRVLRGKTFYNVHEKIYCEEDYLYSGFQATAEKCAACEHLIMETILQAMGKSFHPGCFRCNMCGKCLDGVAFTIDSDNKIFCIADYHRMYAPKCGACGQAITPLQGSDETVRVVSMDMDFHVDCFRCQDCGQQLTDEPDKRCYPLNDRRLCHSCHVRRSSGSAKTAVYG